MAKQYSRNRKHSTGAKNPGHKLPVQKGDLTEGERFGVGVDYMTVLNERANLSLNRNGGPTRPSADDATIPMIRKGNRRTGQVR